MVSFEQIDVTGCRAKGPMTFAGEIGPKHHAIILGRNTIDGLIYVAELLKTGYQIATFADFDSRYSKNGDISIEPLEDTESGLQSAHHALAEIASGANSKYNLITNNCESFVNRSIKGSSVSGQVVTTIGLLIQVASVWILKRRDDA